MPRFIDSLRWSLLVVIVFVAGLLMVGAAGGDALIIDESPHVVAGYSYMRFFDYRLNPEHPPLVKILAALPLVFQKINFPLASQAWTEEINGQWTLGREFLYESGNNADLVISWARLGPILLTLILVFLIYLWAKDLIGRWWALLPAFLFAFTPTVLAHGHYVTTDVGAAIGIFVALFSFIKYLDQPTRKRLILSGLALGAALLLKFSTFLLLPFFVLLMIIFCVVRKRKDWPRFLGALALIFAAAFALIYAVYFIFTANYPVEIQIRDTRAQLATFTPEIIPKITEWAAGNPILRPFAQYFLGLFMVLQRASGGNTAYFLGELSNAGWPHYFPVVYLLKESSGILAIVAFAFFLGFWRFFKSVPGIIFKRGRIREYLTTNFAEFAMLLFIAVYWLNSVSSILNIGVRHIIPTLPFIYILSAGAMKKWINFGALSAARGFIFRILSLAENFYTILTKSMILAGALLWILISTIIAYPHFLSYFNIFSGGTSIGYRYVTDSNYDWGQDLKRLATWVRRQGIDKIAIDYFGGGSPTYYLGDQAELWQSGRGNPNLEGIQWLAVSINTLQGAKSNLGGTVQRAPEEEYQWLENYEKPFARAGKSIFIYKLIVP